jgi:Protein of unknown function (DUF3304)
VNTRSWTSICLMALLVTGCSGTDNTSIELSGLNYTNAWITMFAVDDYGGHGISPNGGGGAFVCCITIPRKWHAGMKVTVRWTGDERLPDSWKERVVEIPKYTKEDIGAFAVHFYPDDSVKVLVTSKTTRYPGYPYPRPK